MVRLLADPVLIAAVVLALYNNLVNLLPQHLHDQVYVPLNLVAGLLLVAWARRCGASWTGMGFSPAKVGSALRWGLGVGVLLPSPLFLALVLPTAVGSLGEARELDSATWPGLAYQTLVRIPLGTALFEEVAFRGVLYGLWARRSSPSRALVVSSVVFGIWHVTATLELLQGSDIFSSGLLVPAVLGGVFATFLGGLLFGWLRQRCGSVYAPVLAHWLINALAAVAAFLAVR